MSLNRPFKRDNGKDIHRGVVVPNNNEPPSSSSSSSSSSLLSSSLINNYGNTTERKKRWNSFMTDLEATCNDSDDDNDDDDNGNANDDDDELIIQHCNEPPSSTNALNNRTIFSNINWNIGGVAAPPSTTFTANNNSDSTSPPLMNSLYMQQLLGDTNSSTTRMVMPGSLVAAASTFPSSSSSSLSTNNNVLPSSLPLREWIAHYDNNNPRCAMGGGTGRMMINNKGYLEEATRIALSLASKVLDQALLLQVQENDTTCSTDATAAATAPSIVIDNLIVSDTKIGTVDFINAMGTTTTTTTDTALGNTTPASTAPNTTPNDKKNQREIIYSFGKVLYELFTMGSSPPSSKTATASITTRTTSCDNTIENNNSAFSKPSSFNMALNIADDNDDDDDDDNEADARRNGRNKQRRHHEELSGERSGDKGCRRTNGRHGNNGRSNGRNDVGHYTTLQYAGLPPSICRLVAHMLDTTNDSSSSKEEEGLELLFRTDQLSVVTQLSDVMSDLRQMVHDPNSFLHDSFVMRLEPVMSESKLYGREDELRRCLDTANGMHNGRTGNGNGNGSTILQQQQQQQPAIMISGFPGCGKSFLVKEMGMQLEKKKKKKGDVGGGGWHTLNCKFDQEVRSRPPLSIVTSAFDNYLAGLCQLDGGSAGEREGVRRRINDLLDHEDIETLCQLIPSLKQVLLRVPTVANNDDDDHNNDHDDNMRHPPVGQKENDEISFNATFAAAEKNRLHHLFGLLVKALSSQIDRHPLLMCADDLQWADAASLELIYSLVEGSSCCNSDDNNVDDNADDYEGHMSSHVFLFVGCYRASSGSSSVDANSNQSLASCIQRMKDCNTIHLEEIHLEGLASENVNAILSDALRYPRRLTRSLADIIHQKSTGNPLFVKEFLNSLATENLLTYSLSKHGWLWDEEVIERMAVSNGVVDLLTGRLERLPKGVLSALQVMSCFGHDVSFEILAHVRDVCDNSDDDIIAGLDTATEELLINKKSSDLRDDQSTVYSFVHDMVQTTVYRGIEERERIRMLKEIADTLIARAFSSSSGEERKDSILFIIVDMVNRVGSSCTTMAEDRVRYAKLDLLAGTEASAMPDFSSALEYIEAGISFLDEGHWEHEYDLSLALFRNAAGLTCSLGKLKEMKAHLSEVFDNARCYEDKLYCMSVLIQSLITAGKAETALKHAAEVLDYLGEPLNTELDDDAIQSIVIETHKYAQQFFASSLDTLPAMKDPTKLQAMHFLNLSLWPSQQIACKSFIVVVACRMVKLTQTHGLNMYSSSALAALACTFTAVLRNPSEGYKLGKLSLALNTSSKLVGELSLAVTSYVFAFKEPIQALLPLILENQKIALKFGTTYSACTNATCYIIRAFLSGSSLGPLTKEMVVHVRQMTRHKKIRPYLCVIPIFNAIAKLSGEPRPPLCDFVQGYEDDEQNLSKAYEKRDVSLGEIIMTIQLMVEIVIFGRMDLAERIVRQYPEYFDLDGMPWQFVTIYRTFYLGLVAFHCFRETQDQYWMDMGTKAITEMEAMTNECKWNFENKMLLLKAEYHFCICEFDKATEGYYLSVTSARKHRFVPEEAIANELAANFQLGRGRIDIAIQFLTGAIECYQSWGAESKAQILRSKVQNLAASMRTSF